MAMLIVVRCAPKVVSSKVSVVCQKPVLQVETADCIHLGKHVQAENSGEQEQQQEQVLG
jgi:hypothetical protein